MRIRALVNWTMLCCVLLMAACGGGSGRRGTDVVVTGVGPSAQVLAGQPAVFTMTVSNAGPDPANNVKINDLIGNQLGFTSITCSADGGATCPATVGLSMIVPTLPVGGSLTFTVTLLASPNASGTLANSMSAQIDGDTDTTNNQFTATAQGYTITSDLGVSGTAPGGSVTGGGTATFVMTVTNAGPDDATNVKISDNVGTGLTLAGITCAASNGATCPTSVGPVMNLATVPNGGVLTFTVNTTVGNAVNGTVLNTLSVTADNDSNRANDSFTGVVNVVTPTNGVFVTGVGPNGTLVGGGPAVFTMQVGNSGPDAASTVGITNQVGAGLNFTGITCVAAGGATCPSTLGPVMSVPSLPAGGTLTFSVNTNVVPGTNGAVTDNMSVTAANDSDRTDNSATAVGTVVTPKANLVTTGAAPAGQVLGGGTAVFVMTVGNTGPDPATNVRVTNTVGSNLTFTGATCTASGGATCPASLNVVANVDTLPVGGLLTFNVSATVANGTNGAITNTVQATADNATNQSGNSAVAVGQAFTARSNVTLTGVGPSNVPAGTTANFQMTLTNTGPQDASNVHLVNTVGSNLTQSTVTCTASGGAVCPTTGAVMDTGTFPVGGTLVFNVGAFVSVGTQGTIIDTLVANVTSGTNSSVTGVGVGSAYSNLLVVSGTAPAGPLIGGASAYFTMTVANNGPGAALNVGISDVLGTGLSPGLANISCLATGSAVCPAAPAATMTVPTLPAGGALTFTVPVIVNAGVNGNVTNTMTATAAGDSQPNNNSAAVSVSVSSVDIGVSETGAAQITAGSTAVFTATVNNPGPSTVSNASVNFTLTGADPATATVTCSAAGGGNCPTPGPTIGSTYQVPSFPSGRTLTFTITVPVVSSGGTIVSTTSVNAPGDPNLANNTATFSTATIDARSGTYTVFAGNGQMYSMVIDFDAGNYTMSGGAQTAFTAGSGSEYIVNGVSRFRVATDMLIGGHDFGTGVVPYLAARSFGTSLGLLSGSYDMLTRDTAANGSITTRPAVAGVSGDSTTLFICQPVTGPPQSISGCNGGTVNYTLSVSGNVYTATPIAGGSTVQFYIVQTGATKLLVSAGATQDPLNQPVQRFRLGLVDVPALAGGSIAGPAEGQTPATSDWVQLTLFGANYSSTGQVGGTQSAALSPVSGLGATSFYSGALASDPAAVLYVMQSGPIVAVFGESTGTANGLLQLALP